MTVVSREMSNRDTFEEMAGDSSSSLESLDSETGVPRRGMPPKTLSRRGSRRNMKVHTESSFEKSARSMMHQSCPVIKESDLDDLLSPHGDDPSSSSTDYLTISETDEEGGATTKDNDEVLDDSLHGRRTKLSGCRRSSSMRNLNIEADSLNIEAD
mmetsp:Transcript_12271/g.16065  ORF Transcript_12271/g.16065 Transcript_12271/m.16065 type:complete len:156 (-) Transcript_12271:235-702(-)|eukprot:CAMPEP_0198146680 /NCGR_PEP_ID=MMETSP1443-20131203/30738_1 /TAXON_ID=186043 /ORGANISM="Entomoneis sp., Strain CCMP2396" /LENGTH=155 /DNA_ID=CAMNT_0043810725 /DNA_START=148 /DNA_END=615 /DNA_ORIENTATION=-